MITKSYLNLRKYLDTGVTSTIQVTEGDITNILGGNLTTVSGGNATLKTYYAKANNTTASSGVYPRIGIGNTAEAVDDYCLDDDVTSQVTNLSWNISSSVSIESGRYCYKKLLTISFVNNTDSTLDISEVAAVFIYNTSHHIMIYRKVIDPIHLENGQGAEIALNWYDF